MTELDPGLRSLLGAVVVLYVVAMYALSLWVRGRIETDEDFIVAGRRLPLSLAWATLLATWFGAGTMLTAADEVRAGGLSRAALDPLGAGLCLLLAGFLVAAPLWKMGLLTVSDFFRRRFGRRAELLSAAILVPSYFGWVAAQLVALAALLELLFGIDPGLGIVLVAIVGTGYTLLGGMWSVTLTDGVQITLVLSGLLYLGGQVLFQLGGDGGAAAGLARLAAETPPELLQLVPTGSGGELLDWIAVLAIGALGNLPGQDLLQRVFAARSAKVAQQACYLAGVAYLLFGAVPVMLGLAGRILIPADLERAVLPALAHLFLRPFPAVVFTLALISAVLSTIDSAILSPASVLAQNVAPRLGGLSHLTLNRIAVVVVAAASTGMAYAGESAYSLLESAYELTMVGLLVPLLLGLWRRPRGEAPALASMLAGGGLWLLHAALGWERFLGPLNGSLGLQLPGSLGLTLASLAAFLAAEGLARRPRSQAG